MEHTKVQIINRFYNVCYDNVDFYKDRHYITPLNLNIKMRHFYLYKISLIKSSLKIYKKIITQNIIEFSVE